MSFKLVRVLFVAVVLHTSFATKTDVANSKSKSDSDNGSPGLLTDQEFTFFQKSFKLLKDSRCKSDLNATFHGLQNGEKWALQMYDANAKSTFGIESGVVHHFGHFDQCLEQKTYHTKHLGPESSNIVNKSLRNHSEIPVRAQYCLADVFFDGITANIDTRQPPVNGSVVHWGSCMPASCSASDVAIFLGNLLQRPVHVDSSMCQIHQSHLNVDSNMFSYAAIIFFFMLLAVLSTCYHVYLILNNNNGSDDIAKSNLSRENLVIALLSFSIIENVKKLLQGSKDYLGLNSINGIKALSMLLILAGHAVSFIYGGPTYNSQFISQQVREPTFAFLSNSLLFVDTFLLLSGFLFCRILLIELERRRGKINVLFLYIGRYIRLTPAYMAIIGFYMTWFPSIAYGPIWQQRIGREQERCQSSWWLNILYINNYLNTDKLCMFQSWYLSVDTQLFFFAPIAIYLLYKSRKHGLRFLVAISIITAIVPFVVTYLNKLDPTLLIYSDEMNDLNSNPFYVNTYIKTHMRASAYLIGLLVGYLVHLMQEKGTKLPRYVVRVAWIASTCIGTLSMYSVIRFYRPFSNIESTLYAGFHKIGWNLSVGWLVLAVTTGHGGWLQKFLSSRIFAPISRLTYCAYLANGVVELYHSSVIRNNDYIGLVQVANMVSGHVLNTFLVALVLCLLFESPIHALERILLRSSRSSNNRKSNSKKEGDSQSPSTSEEQVP